VIRRVGFVLVLLTAVSITAGAAAVLPIERSAPLQVIDADAPSPAPPPEPSPPPSHKVWVCVVLVHHDTWQLKPGRNPIEVASVSQIARDGADPDHPSYLVSAGDERCALPGS
jgi:hypothetical protein